MEEYLHKIIDSDDLDTMESKSDHNTALMNNTQLQIIHKGIKQEMNKEKLEKTEGRILSIIRNHIGIYLEHRR